VTITPTADGVRLRIRVQPSASRSEVAGRYGDAIRVRLASPPVDGKANEALARLLSELLAVPRRAVSLCAGGGSRSKVVEVVGVDVATATRLLLGRD
jgi:uncharacterized protein (TIGR00251 family)